MKPRILFLEDQPHYFEPFIDALEEHYDVERAEDLAEAIEILRKRDFVLLIIDIMLPKGQGEFPGVDDRRSGLYLIRLIRGVTEAHGIKFRCRRDIPILVVTAVSDLSVHKELESLKVPVVEKPFSMRKALDQVAGILKEAYHVA